IDEEAARKIRSYIEIGKSEGRHELTLEVPAGLEAKVGKPFVGPTIFSSVKPDARIAREEIFGPVLAVMHANDFEEALAIANSPEYKLTGGVFSRKPAHLARARREFRVGNLYLNRGITGALVGRQPFGGFGMSGIGSKAGGRDYLLQFVEPRAVCENTMRRGFAPGREGATLGSSRAGSFSSEKRCEVPSRVPRGFRTARMQRVLTFALRGIDALPVEVECDERPPRRSSGPDGAEEPRGGISLVGLPDASVREAVTRVRAALSNSELPTPRGTCTVNLAPADLRKEGPLYDLPIALAVLRMQGVLDEGCDEMFARYGVAGELALDGLLRPIRGSTSFAAFARDQGLHGIVVPKGNAPEAAAVRGISVH
ncbi:MAG: aldehyde dehydrogenase family protein, partial [Phycisphaerales bacterium]